ncbi:MAG: hypothetical protein WD431_17835 [Cyclobacteriaceae bacterium]
MNSDQFQTYAKSQATKSINQANINAIKMKAIEIPFPEELKQQRKVVKGFLECETKIRASQGVIDGIAERKEKIIKSYLLGNEPESLSGKF